MILNNKEVFVILYSLFFLWLGFYIKSTEIKKNKKEKYIQKLMNRYRNKKDLYDIIKDAIEYGRRF
jgi:GH35 family endo-1,4-beta-xylanase